MSASTDHPASLTKSAGLFRSPARTSFVVGVLEGEGVGPELVRLCLMLLDRIGERFDRTFVIRTGGAIGMDAIRQGDEPLPQSVKDFCSGIFDEGGAVFAGAGGSRFVYDMRAEFDLFVKFNPLPRYPELSAAGKGRVTDEAVDLLVVRENLGGLYQGTSHVEASGGRRRVEHRFSYDEDQVGQITDIAARIAATRRGGLAVVAKQAGLPDLTDLWFCCGRRSARDHDVDLRVMDIDFAAYALISAPHEFDVMVAPNCFGDILADIGGNISGSRGMTYGSSHAVSGAAVYQTNHGAAYDLAGTDRANPAGQILALAMMLRESFALDAEALAIERAVRQTWREGWRTDDLQLGGPKTIGMHAFGRHVLEHLEHAPVPVRA